MLNKLVNFSVDNKNVESKFTFLFSCVKLDETYSPKEETSVIIKLSLDVTGWDVPTVQTENASIEEITDCILQAKTIACHVYSFFDPSLSKNARQNYINKKY